MTRRELAIRLSEIYIEIKDTDPKIAIILKVIELLLIADNESMVDFWIIICSKWYDDIGKPLADKMEEIVRKRNT